MYIWFQKVSCFIETTGKVPLEPKGPGSSLARALSRQFCRPCWAGQAAGPGHLPACREGQHAAAQNTVCVLLTFRGTAFQVCWASSDFSCTLCHFLWDTCRSCCIVAVLRYFTPIQACQCSLGQISTCLMMPFVSCWEQAKALPNLSG